MKARFVPNDYEGILTASITSPATQTTYSSGDTFNPNGMTWDVMLDNQRIHALPYNASKYLNQGDTLNADDTHEELDVYLRHQRTTTKQNISVT